MYFKGHGVEKSYEEAAKWYEKAAKQGFAEAQFSLGAMYYNGYGVEQSYEEAAKWYEKAAEQQKTHFSLFWVSSFFPWTTSAILS